MSVSRKKELWMGPALALASLVGSFLVLEAVFKIGALLRPDQTCAPAIRGLPYENTPGITFWRYDREAGFNRYRHNSFGMRGREITRAKPPGVYRIAFLGDSVVHGGNVNQGEEMPAVVERLLNERGGIRGRRVECLNFGVASYGLREYSIVLDKKAMEFDPDLVAVAMSMNDFVILDRKQKEGCDKGRRGSWLREKIQNLFKSHLLEFLGSCIDFDRWRRPASVPARELAARNALGRLPFLSPKDREAILQYVSENRIPLEALVSWMRDYLDLEKWRKNGGTIGDICRRAAGAKIPALFFVYPLSEQVQPGFDCSQPQETIRDLAGRSGGRYFEILGLFRAYRTAHPQEKIFPTYDNMHFFKNGHRLIAGWISAGIEKAAGVVPGRS